MKISFDITDFEVMFDQEKEEFYIDLCDFKYAICAEIEFAGVIESNIKFEFTGELEREETVLGKVYSLGKYGEERDEVQAICTADLSRWRTEKEKLYFNTEILFEDDI